MNKHFKSYLDSFKPTKNHLYTFLTDLIVFSLIFLSFSWLSAVLQRKSAEVLQGKSAEEIQTLLASTNPEQLLPFLTQLKSFLIWSIIIALVVIIIYFLLFSLSQAVIWYHLLKKKLTHKIYWRWNLLDLFLIIPLLVFGFFYLIIRLLSALLINAVFSLVPKFSLLHPAFMQNIRLFYNGTVNFFCTVIILVILLLICHQFALKYKVWEAVGKGFSLLKQKWSSLGRLILFSTATGLILMLITLPIKKALLYSPLALNLVNLVVVLAFLAWLRIYLFKTLAEEQK